MNIEHSKHGVSLIIAILLLIIIATLAAIVTYIWITGYTQNMESQAEKEGKKIKLYVKIEGIQPYIDNNVCIAPSTPCSQGKYYCYYVWVNNIGDEKVYIKDLYVIDPTTKTTVWYSIYTSGGEIDPRTNQYLWLSIPCDKIVSGKQYLIKLTLKNGYEVYYLYKFRE